MKVAVGLSFFDNAKEINRCLGSKDDKNAINNNVDYIIGINGRYDGYDIDHNYSIDGSDDLIKKYPNAIVENYHGYQTDKRQRYLDIAGELKCDWLIVIDTDEYLDRNYTDWQTFYKNLITRSKLNPQHKLFNIYIFLDLKWRRAYNMVRRNRFRKYIRIHKDPSSMRYCCQTHYYWCDKSITDDMLAIHDIPNDLMLKEYDPAIDGIRFATDSLLRSKETLKLRDKWAWNTTHEENRRVAVLKDNNYYHTNKFPDPQMKRFFEYDKKGRIKLVNQ